MLDETQTQATSENRSGAMIDPCHTTVSLAAVVGASAFWLCSAIIGLASAAGAAESVPPEPESGVFRVYVGTYTSGSGAEKSRGIYLLDLDLKSGKLGEPRVACEAIDPSFLAIHPSGKYLYAVSERSDDAGRGGGAVLGFSIDPATGELISINQQSSRGASPCHLVVDRSGKNVLVANYSSGTLASLPIDADGRLGESSSFIQHKGKGSDPGRQRGPHAHSINLDRAGRFAVAADLGLDKVFVYRFDDLKGTLAANEPPFAEVAPKSGPRHFAFHPSGRFGYVIAEMANTVTAFEYDDSAGALKEIQTISTLPADFRGRSYTAEVQVHPSGKFVYGSNRGHDSIAIFAVDSATGKLSSVGVEPTQGRNPRNFAIDPTGAYLLAENGDSGTIVVFRIDAQNGALLPTGQSVRVPKPVCIKMIAKPAGATR
jgi:6-phosphogluconolactonase